MTSRRATFARSQRQSAGLATTRVWEQLCGGRVDGHKFRREHPIGRFTADFACERLRLILEIDGGVHGVDEVATNDHLRQVELESLGWTVLRFSNDQAVGQPQRIAAAIRQHARSIDL